jgi:phage portal protein BeeE
MSLLDRLFGPSTALAVPEPEVIEAKAVTGPGAFAMEHNVPLRSLGRTPQAMARQAMDTFRSNEWINTAEGLIDDKFATVKWHLEDTAGETVEENQVPGFLRQPNPVWSRSAIWKLTCRHMGLTGRSFWYLDALDRSTSVPQAVYTIPPDRMWAATDRGGNLRGWIMDADRPDGREPVPFTLDEIIQFPLDPPDHGYFGVGKVEAAWRKVLLTQHTDEYAAGVFASGGRLPGLMFPRPVASGNVTFNTDEWESFVRAVRESTSGERRMSALRAAVDYVSTSAKPNEMETVDLSALSRDDTLAIWKIPKSQLGMEAKTGLNGGERNKYDEAALWQNAIEPRLSTFVELLQTRILDNLGLVLVLETPNFDDDLPLFEMAEKARYVPLSINRRLALAGMDPLDEAVYGAELGNAIYVDKSMVQIFPEPEVPEPLAPFAGTDNIANGDIGANDDTEMPETDITAKAKLSFEQIRARIERQYAPQIRRAVDEVLQAQKAEFATRIRDKADHITAKPDDVRVWWNEHREYQRMQAALEPVLLAAAADVTRNTSATFFRPVKADSLVERVLTYVRDKVGQRIRGINDTTRDKLKSLIAEGVNRGDSPAALGDAIEASAAFDEYRSELIARTETMLAYNDAAIGTYRDFGVEEVQAIDGDDDAECARRNGAIFSLAEASGISDHPNGTLDWVPVVKSVIPPDPMMLMAEAIKASLERPNTITVTTPDIHVNTPDVKLYPTFNAPAIHNYMPEMPVQEPPIVNVTTPDAKAAGPAEVTVVSMPNRIKVAQRDNEGNIERMVETDLTHRPED